MKPTLHVLFRTISRSGSVLLVYLNTETVTGRENWYQNKHKFHFDIRSTILPKSNVDPNIPSPKKCITPYMKWDASLSLGAETQFWANPGVLVTPIPPRLERSVAELCTHSSSAQLRSWTHPRSSAWCSWEEHSPEEQAEGCPHIHPPQSLLFSWKKGVKHDHVCSHLGT